MLSLPVTLVRIGSYSTRKPLLMDTSPNSITPPIEPAPILCGALAAPCMDDFASPEPCIQPAGPADERQCVLILEDDETQRRLLVQHLHSIGFETLEAATIRDAEEKLSNGRLCLAILDIHLPDGSGLEFCERIDEHPQRSGLPIIVLSSMTCGDVVRRTRSAGGRFFLSKPYDPNVLLALIEAALDDRF